MDLSRRNGVVLQRPLTKAAQWARQKREVSRWCHGNATNEQATTVTCWDVSCWPKADIPMRSADVCFRGHSCRTDSFDCSRRRLATAYADSGSIRFNVIKAGFVVGGSGGS